LYTCPRNLRTGIQYEEENKEREREREVTTDPKSMKESGSHARSTDKPHPGKKMKEIENPVESHVLAERLHSLVKQSANQMNWGQCSVKPITTQWCLTLEEPIRNKCSLRGNVNWSHFLWIKERWHRWANHLRGIHLTIAANCCYVKTSLLKGRVPNLLLLIPKLR